MIAATAVVHQAELVTSPSPASRSVLKVVEV
jgi:predicted nucleic acid-binding protein